MSASHPEIISAFFFWSLHFNFDKFDLKYPDLTFSAFQWLGCSFLRFFFFSPVIIVTKDLSSLLFTISWCPTFPQSFFFLKIKILLVVPGHDDVFEFEAVLRCISQNFSYASFT